MDELVDLEYLPQNFNSFGNDMDEGETVFLDCGPIEPLRGNTEKEAVAITTESLLHHHAVVSLLSGLEWLSVLLTSSTVRFAGANGGRTRKPAIARNCLCNNFQFESRIPLACPHHFFHDGARSFRT